MEQFFQFVGNHWFLWSVLVILIALFILQELQSQRSVGKRLSAQDAINLINRQNALVVDVRDKTNFLDGHVIGALNLPLKNLDKSDKKLQKYKKKPIVVMDVNGQAAVKACGQLTKDGYENVNYLNGGIRSWRQAGLPLIKE
ncbi:MAG: rhodanese-like domain-containing protein [Pseudomonadota bacterium]